MALQFAANSHAEQNQAVVATRPITIAGWFHVDSVSTGYIATLCNLSGTNIIGLLVRGADGLVTTVERSGGGWQSHSESPITTGAWQHAAAVFSNVTSRQVFLDGVPASLFSSGSAAGTVDYTTLRTRPGSPQSTDGLLLAEVGIWNVALAADEISLLAGGMSPLSLRRLLRNLVLYQPLYDGLGKTFVGPELSLVGSATANAHPRIVAGATPILDHGVAMPTPTPFVRQASQPFVAGHDAASVFIAGSQAATAKQLA